MGGILTPIFFPAGESSYTEHSPMMATYQARIYDIKSTHSARRILYAFMPCYMKDSSEMLEPRCVLFFHGNSEDVGDCLPMLARVRDELRANIFAVEYPGYGLNPQKTSPDPELIKEDSLNMFDFLTNNLRIRPEHILVFGRSIGSGAACHLSGNRSSVSNLLLLSPLFSVDKIIKDKVGWVKMFTCMQNFFNNEESVRNTKARLLMVHGRKDNVIPVQHGIDLVKAYNETHPIKSEPVLPQNMGHNNINEYLSQVIHNTRLTFKEWCAERQQALSMKGMRQAMDSA